MPPAVRARYREHFLTFKDYCGEHGVTALSAHGATVARWLLHLAAVERRTLAEVTAEAVGYYHSLQGDACTDAALSIAAKIGGGDDGGGIESNDGGSEVPPSPLR
jgi:hypothetical protein